MCGCQLKVTRQGAAPNRGLNLMSTIALFDIAERTGISATVGWTGMNGVWPETTFAITAGL